MVIKPLRRIEHFLAKIAGSPYAKDLTPITRKEYWLNEIAKSGGGGGGGGANILTLYVNSLSSDPSKAYKNPECTEEYESYNEASDALRNADIIQIVDKTESSPEGGYYVFTALSKAAAQMSEAMSMVIVTISTMTATLRVALWYTASEPPR